MARHPLDISNFITSEPKPAEVKFEKTSPKPVQATPEPTFVDGPRIQKQYWSQLNPESRRIFTSRMWKGVDFNPMLSELSDLSKLTEKWLRWAIPTYVNGLASGPIKDWFNGTRGPQDFHYVLVGEHLKHLKEVRQNRKEELKDVSVELEAPIRQMDHTVPSESVMLCDEDSKMAPELKMALNELDEHIQWFQNYLNHKSVENEFEKS